MGLWVQVTAEMYGFVLLIGGRSIAEESRIDTSIGR